MLGHLQDDSMEDLIDAAKSMTDEDRQKRLAELQGKRQNLNFSYPGKTLGILWKGSFAATIMTFNLQSLYPIKLNKLTLLHSERPKL